MVGECGQSLVSLLLNMVNCSEHSTDDNSQLKIICRFLSGSCELRPARVTSVKPDSKRPYVIGVF